MDCKCERCGSLIDLLGRDPFLPELSSYRCDSCERIAADADSSGPPEFQVEARRAA
jgi:DNA-directed RNA polymerase subunit RPC12/RpoP